MGWLMSGDNELPHGRVLPGTLSRLEPCAVKVASTVLRGRGGGNVALLPDSEALFRTCKYVPTYPVDGFAALSAARDWVQRFVRWYNHEHRHSGIRFVTPAQRHAGQDAAILNRRHALNQQARSRNPSRWSGKTRNWEPVHTVALNPDRELEIQQAPPKKLAA